MSEAINYKISLDKKNKHLLAVECKIARPNAGGQIVSFPAWVPGSYMIRDFAKFVFDIKATGKGKPVTITKISKNSWQCDPCDGELVISYHTYGFDGTPRAAYIDNERVFFDGCRIFLVVEGEEEQTCSVEIIPSDLKENSTWRCATSMTPVKINKNGFGTYVAENHLDLIDHPFEIGNFDQLEFVVNDVPHTLVISGARGADLERFAVDLQKVCQGHVDFFGELPVMQGYVFILHVYANAFGGLEHRSSCTLSCSRNDLPIVGDAKSSEGYIHLLALCSHEYFHLWNVKRIKPEVFVNPDLRSEAYTRQLWVFEGITSYFDNLNLLRQKLITLEQYLEVVQKDLTRLLQNPGAYVQTLEDSSFDAWIKFYQPDENSINSMVSYYLKGSFAALVLDLMIIRNSRSKQSLADIMQVLWQQYGRTGLGLPEKHFERVVFEVTGENYDAFFDSIIRSTEPLPLAELFLEIGIIYRDKDVSLLESCGLKVIEERNKLSVRSVLSDSPAEKAGIAANDIIIAVNDNCVNLNNIEIFLKRFAQQVITIHYVRDELLHHTELKMPQPNMTSCEFEIVEDANTQQELQRTKWLS